MLGIKTGGRKAGTPNKRRGILEVCQGIGLDPFIEMAKMAQSCPDDTLRFAALKELCQYIEPKKRAMDITSDGEEVGFKIILCDYTNQIEEKK